jgi:hypothetical protein
MSQYVTSRLMWEVTRDRDLAARYVADPASVLEGLDLTDAEREALIAQDIRALFQLGLHPFIVYHYALRLAGGNSFEFMMDYLGKLEGLTVGNLET